jgi:curved DNA-binding protein CbpA
MVGFDLEARKQLFSINPAAGWADEYEFLEEQAVFCVRIRDVGLFRYDQTGAFLDEAAFLEAKLNSNRFDLVLPTAELLLKDTERQGVEVARILAAVSNARSNGADGEQQWKALALKLQGTCHELLGNDGSALLAFNEAMSINPKIGVKRKVESLRKKIESRRGVR